MRGIQVSGSKIRQLRKARGLTQQELAFQAQCDVKTIRKAENSKRVDLSTAGRLAAVLGVNVRDLAAAPTKSDVAAGVAIVQAWTAAFNSRDPQAVAKVYDDNGVIIVMASPNIPGGGTFTGKEEIRRWAQESFNAFDVEKMGPDNQRIDTLGDVVFLRTARDLRVTSCATGQIAYAGAANEMRFADGKILEHRIYADTNALASILGE